MRRSAMTMYVSERDRDVVFSPGWWWASVWPDPIKPTGVREKALWVGPFATASEMYRRIEREHEKPA